MKGEKATGSNKEKRKIGKNEWRAGWDTWCGIEGRRIETANTQTRKQFLCVSINLFFYLFGLFQDFVKRLTVAIFIVIWDLSCCLLPNSPEFTVHLKPSFLCLIGRHILQTMSTWVEYVMFPKPEINPSWLYSLIGRWTDIPPSPITSVCDFVKSLDGRWRIFKMKSINMH